MRNRLAETSSPYLLQHKDNPVHWQPWGEEAFAEAARLDRPVLLSSGYAACHWCHVMAHESFETIEIAALMNAHFVSIKLDREERPDIDHACMTALHAMGEQGGWPLTMALTPDGQPFWGGTYFPPAPRFGRPSFAQVLHALARAWAEDRPRLLHAASAIGRALAAQGAADPGPGPTPALLDRARALYLRGQDWAQGGLGRAPKFPNAPVYRFLWQDGFRAGDPDALRATHLLLERMSLGGIHDHLGGGYARYATDAAWLIPHFEKMLYDNAQILELLALAFAHDTQPLYAARAREMVAWLRRDMAHEDAFAAALDADSDGEEGKFYVWTREEIAGLLGAATERFAAHYPLPREGNWEHKIILERVSPLGAEDELAPLRAKLFAHRALRVAPKRDDKILTDWNALTIAALARAGLVFAEPAWLTLAADLFDAVRARLTAPDGTLGHGWAGGRISAPGLLEDYAALLRAALALYEALGAPRYLAAAREIFTQLEARFTDGAGAYFMSPPGETRAPRLRNPADGPTPSGLGLTAEALARLYHLTGEAAYRDKAEALLGAFGGTPETLINAPTMLAAADLLANGACVVITGGAEGLARVALTAPDPAIIVLRAEAGALSPAHPAHGKPADRPAAYVCRAGTCGLPVTDESALRDLLARKATLSDHGVE
ncbi:thioredoxin domain-containing protein [Acidocella sp.]|uniref:thioredoxin domain-containing protein n=1 Tax=Acidocella sp. TaxID=50710 RepID=UPI002627C200|nr:thioredoxin domain-containing protein [Acidocella sp.]